MPANEASPVPIVWDAMIASRGIQEGKLTPLVILDTIKRPDIVELARIHQHLPFGDAISQWGEPYGKKDKLTLYLKFIRPSEINILLEFDVERQAALIDQIIRSSGIYIQPGKPGDRTITTQSNPKILIQIPDGGFKLKWEEIFKKNTVDNFKRRGFKTRPAKEAARMFVEEWRKFGNFRMP